MTLSLPQPSTFGEDFNYSVWTPGTEVMLCNVPWNSDYRDIVKFDTQAALDTYLQTNSGPTFTFTGLTYARPGIPVRVNLPFNACYQYNYLRVVNGAQPIPGDTARTFYYFVTDVRYIAPNTTEIMVQLDVWQTFNRNVSFGNCYIERGHVGIANENAMSNNGRDYLTIPEGLDLGNEYTITRTYEAKIADLHDQWNPSVFYDIIVATTVSFEGSGGTVTAPILKTAKGSGFGGMPNGVEFYLFDTIDYFRTFMAALADMPWVSQGIISVMVVPQIPRTSLQTETVSLASGPAIQRLMDFTIPPQKYTGVDSYWSSGMVPARYAELTKFQTYPYSLIEMTTYSGKPLILKPECLAGTGVDVVVLMHLALPDPRVVVYPYRYNSTNPQPDELDVNGDVLNDQSEFLDMATGIYNLPTFSVVNNSYMNYLASNANGIAYQHSSADWSQQRALAGNALGFEQSTAGMQLSQSLTGMSVNAMNASTALANQTAALQGLTSVGKTAAGGAILGGGVGAAIGAAGGVADVAIGMNQRNQQTAINTGLARSQNQAQVGNQGFMRDTNKEYADFAARGDYQNAIAGVNAKVQDAKMIQPTTSGQIGGDAFNLAQYRWAVHFKVKTLQPAAMAAIGEYWLRYGYAVNRFGRMPASMMVMDHFTYWKLRETYLLSTTCPEGFKQAIRGIFEKGVTVWANPADIGVIDMADNHALAGVTL